MVIGPELSTDGTTPLIAEPAPGAHEAVKAIEGRSLGRIAWTRLKRDKVAMTGGFVIIFLILVAIFAPLIVKLLGSPPNEFHQDLIDTSTLQPRGTFGGMSGDHLLGIEPTNGRDIFSRVVYGARISLMIAFLATFLSVSIGVTLGVIAGYFGGWADAIISRAMDAFLALRGNLPGGAFPWEALGLTVGLAFLLTFVVNDLGVRILARKNPDGVLLAALPALDVLRVATAPLRWPLAILVRLLFRVNLEEPTATARVMFDKGASMARALRSRAAKWTRVGVTPMRARCSSPALA